MSNNDDVPDGFELVDPVEGFGSGFGNVYFNKRDNKLGFRVAPHHLNPFGACHGGAMATFADMQAVAVKSALDAQTGHTPTIHLAVDYLAPARLGKWVEAVVTLAKVTQTMVFTQALVNADGEIVARSSAIYRRYGAGESAARPKT